MITFIFFTIATTYLLVRHQERIADKDIFNRLVTVLFLIGAFLSATLTLPGFFVDEPILWQRFVVDPLQPIVLYLIPTTLAVLLYRRIAIIPKSDIIGLIVWGIASLGIGTFIGFFMTMDNPLLNIHGPSEYSSNGWLLQIALRGIVFYILSTLVVCVPYVAHARSRGSKIGILVLFIGFPAIPFLMAYGRYFIALIFGI